MTDKPITDHSGAEGWRTYGLYLACGALIVIILFLDLWIPLGAAVGVIYIMVILISLWSPQKIFTIFMAVICSVFVIGTFFYQPTVPEMWKVVFNRSVALFAIWVTTFLGLQRKIGEENREKVLRERETALQETRILRGLLPICASCKKIRDDQGYWTQIEGYIRAHSEAEFTHGICPECTRKLYPELYKEKNHDSDTDT